MTADTVVAVACRAPPVADFARLLPFLLVQLWLMSAARWHTPRHPAAWLVSWRHVRGTAAAVAAAFRLLSCRRRKKLGCQAGQRCCADWPPRPRNMSGARLARLLLVGLAGLPFQCSVARSCTVSLCYCPCVHACRSSTRAPAPCLQRSAAQHCKECINAELDNSQCGHLKHWSNRLLPTQQQQITCWLLDMHRDMVVVAVCVLVTLLLVCSQLAVHAATL